MKLLTKTITCLFLGTVAASASPVLCNDNSLVGASGSLASYIALGSSGCLIGDTLFTNFAYSYSISGTGGGVMQASTDVKVAVNYLNQEFQFGANWVVDHTQTANLSLSFTVTAPATHQLNRLTNAFTSAANSGPSNITSPIYTESATCVLLTCSPLTTFTNSTVGITPTTGPVNIANTVAMNANGTAARGPNNIYHLSIISDQFLQTAPPGDTPEPATYIVMGTGLALLAAFRKAKRA
jgi:hypothetical protein